MIIKLIPETDAEKKKFQEKFGSDKIVHKNVKEYFFFGNKKSSNNDGGLIDVHEWTGSYRYLMSSLKYFYEMVNDERKEHDYQPQIRQPLNVNKFMANHDDGDEDEDETETIKVNAETLDKGFIKHGTVANQNVATIDVEAIKNPHIVQMRPEDLETITDKLNKEADWIANGDNGDDGDNGEDNSIPSPSIPIPPPPIKFQT